MQKEQLFHILDSVDSTNNYAMARINEGMAQHGMAWFAREQTQGKGQRGRQWHSQADSNILMSIAIMPTPALALNPFFLSALVAETCNSFLRKISGEDFFIKWPNDIYWRDRKTGGILIENKYSGTQWHWAVIGIGINVNQQEFNEEAMHAISLKQVSGVIHYNPVSLAKELHQFLMEKINSAHPHQFEALITGYNNYLYKRGAQVKLKKENAVFTSTIVEVNQYGQLITRDSLERIFNFGEVQWVIP